MRYLANDKSIYEYSYQSLIDDFNRIKIMGDIEFVDKIIEILHYSVFICYIKEIRNEDCLGDQGIVHELIHILDPKTRYGVNLKEVRAEFERVCELK